MTAETLGSADRLARHGDACERLGPERARDVALDVVPEGDLFLGVDERDARQHLEHTRVRLAVELGPLRSRRLLRGTLDEGEELRVVQPELRRPLGEEG